jgi:hypothetical protein
LKTYQVSGATAQNNAFRHGGIDPGVTMNKTLLVIVFVALSGLAQGASAQDVGVGLRAGSVGIGGEGALGIRAKLVIRGGLALTPFDFKSEIDDIEYTIELPDSWYNIGVDFYPRGSFRIGGGMLFKSEGPRLTGKPNTSVEIGDEFYTPEELGTLEGKLVSGDKAPYVIIGFGKHTEAGFGLFVDLGVAFLGDPEIELDAVGGNFLDQDELRTQLNNEETRLEDQAGQYLSYYPFLSVGVRFGIS